MSVIEKVPTSRLRMGHARVDITPPVGIYHRTWGAARHDRASGVHRSLFADVLYFAPLAGEGRPHVRAYLDMTGLIGPQQAEFEAALAAGARVAVEDVIISYSHTHSAGWFRPDRFGMPGGDLIEPFLGEVARLLGSAAKEASASSAPATLTYAASQCGMATNRDFPDTERGIYACGHHPGAPAENTVLTVRATGEDGAPVVTLVHYGCHPTTLAWENSLLSPDFVGGIRDVVEPETGVPCVFAQGLCGDLGPRIGFGGDPGQADRNGRALGFAALSALAALDPPGTDFEYAGPVVSGATLGTWKHSAHDAERVVETSRYRGGSLTVDIPLKPRQSVESLSAEVAEWDRRREEADAAGDTEGARDAHARAERARRWIGRLADLPEGDTYPMRCSAWLLGDALWLTTGGEPYSALVTSLRREFAGHPVLVSPLTGDLQVAYLLQESKYGRGLYQEECSIGAPGCLERLEAALAERAMELIEN